ncbi:MAG: FAD-dependent oxidoreductase [Dehalococcoidales bacterium]|nr:FAD-dependent oxidoreductase [Dehalococcoidales bacterium]
MNQVPMVADIIIIGSGAAGLAAAVTAAEGGARVIIFEKQRSPGGTSNFFQGTFAVESELQRERYITYSRDEAFRNIMEYSHWIANPRLVRAIVNESAGTISWLIRQGVVFSDVTINMPDAPRTYHVIRGKGEALVKALITRAREKGAVIRLATPVKSLIRQGNRIAGAIAEIDGEDTPVSARAVVIASGGYANNKEWVKKFTGFDLGVNLIPVGNVDKTGDGIRMAWEAGAGEEGKSLLELYRVGPTGPDFAMGNQIEFAATQPDLWVSPRGERFCDESIAFYDSSVGNANARFREGYTWSIFDEGIIRRLLERGVDKNVGIDSMPGARPADIHRELKAALDRGSSEVCAAETVEGLADKMQVSPAVLKATIEEYNSYCEQRYDALFAKDPKYLYPVREPKYYAVKARTVFLGTMGGIKINEKTEVLDKKDNPIPGLYAAGFDAGGMYGDSYPIKASSGLASAFALNSGRIAGRNALRYIGK